MNLPNSISHKLLSHPVALVNVKVTWSAQYCDITIYNGQRYVTIGNMHEFVRGHISTFQLP